VGDPLSFPLPPYMASLIVSENWPDLGFSTGQKFVEAVFRLLRPYSGRAYLAFPPAEPSRLIEEVTSAKIPGAKIRAQRYATEPASGWVMVSRDGPLPNSAAWSHETADAANTGASDEQFLKAPLELLWFDTPPRWFRTPGSTLVRVGGGRMFVKAQRLCAIDVYTGRQLWETGLPFAHKETDQMVVVEDAVYVASGRTCLVLDPATGRKTAQFDLPANLAGPWLNLRICQDALVGQSGKYLLCMDRHSGRLAWTYECGRASLSVAVGGHKVFCSELIDKLLGKWAAQNARARALDLTTGKLLWEIPAGSEVRYSSALDLVVLSSGVYRAADGSLLAALPDEGSKPGSKTSPENLPKPLFLVGTKMLFGTAESYLEYDLRTGKPSGPAMTWMRRGCTIPRASSNFVTTRFRGNAACIDLDSREIISFWNVRAACSNNLFPADGVLNMPSLNGGCTCNYLPVSQAFVPASVNGLAFGKTPASGP